MEQPGQAREGSPLLNLPNELLLRVLAWVPYRPRSHRHLPLVCRHLYTMMQAKSLPGMVARYQFSPFMRLLEGYRGRSTSDFSRNELLQTWKSVAMHRDWTAFLKGATGQSSDFCLVSSSIFHFIAAAHRKVVANLHMGLRYDLSQNWKTFLFLARVIRVLPAECSMLLHYVTRLTIEDMHDRHGPFDFLQHLRTWPIHNPAYFTDAAKTFALNCMLQSTCVLLSMYRPFYNIMADENLYSEHMCADSMNIATAIDILRHPPSAGSTYYNAREHLSSGIFSLHIRLVEISNEGDILCPLNIEVESGAGLSSRLTSEHARMSALSEQIDKRFADHKWASQMVQNLNLEAIGGSLKAIVSELDAMEGELILNPRDADFGMYKLDQWP